MLLASCFFFSSRRRHTRWPRDWSSDVCSSDLEIDLVDIKQIDTVFNMQIFAQGIPIYMKNENEFIRQKMRAYSMYATLSEQRAPIIEAIKERGSVFGDE